MTDERIHLSRTVPSVYEKIAAFSTEVGQVARAAGVPATTAELVQLHASQLNGCAYCIRVHTKRLLTAGETAERLAMLPAWREAGIYDERERAALEVVEAITLIGDGGLTDREYRDVLDILSVDEYAAISWIGVAINAFNRVAIAGRYATGPHAAGR
ncbi:carboxymuconolactone decarboxylase family protein [Labedella populi]|uniref:Carboxymuconolactone decarboxylase family protein n=1 Tax=Labedella populi TaxID=2498850 RepID=A0A444QGH3_9MICO|nr:carboxymuconolactone decarboxylase family protein [Labedella populi]RWZ68610.1 carboxymuconolactone decarboxylase family protein [Labedella populi]